MLLRLRLLRRLLLRGRCRRGRLLLRRRFAESIHELFRKTAKRVRHLLLECCELVRQLAITVRMHYDRRTLLRYFLRLYRRLLRRLRCSVTGRLLRLRHNSPFPRYDESPPTLVS